MNKLDNNSEEIMPLNNYLPATNEYEEYQKRISILVNELRKSPMFQLSLSSKELFHSNFLYWIWQVSPAMFKDVIRKLYESAEKESPVDSWAENFIVTREHKHFDLCVTDKKNNVLMVIENKVKSIPNKPQLDNYITQSFKANHLLLSLVGKNFPEYSEIKETWTTVDYSDLAHALSSIAAGKCGYEYDIIRDYVNYIGTLHKFADEWAKVGATVKVPYEFKRKDYEELRIGDIYQKLLFSQILILITERLGEKKNINRKHVFHKDNESKPNTTLYVNSGLTNSNGFLEVKVKIEPDIAILIQVQGNQYRRCVEFHNEEDEKEKKWPSLAENIAWLRKDAPYRIKKFFALKQGHIPDMPYPRSIGVGSPYRCKRTGDDEDSQSGFCKYGNCFIYQYLKIEGKSIGDIVKAVVEDVNNFRSIVGKDDAD